MKKLILGIFAGFILTCILSFSYYEYVVKKNTAEVEYMDGLYIFTDSKPVSEFEYLGTSKVTFGLGSTQYSSVRNMLIKKIKKEYKDANGVIFHFENGGTDKADAILIK